jgi:hypothetical protein
MRDQLYLVALDLYGNERSAAFEVETTAPILRNPKLYERVRRLRPLAGDVRELGDLKSNEVSLLTSIGVARLDSRDQETVLELKQAMAQASLAICGGFWAGGISDTARREAVRGLTETQQRAWITVTARALSREIEAEESLPKISRAEVEQATVALTQSLPPNEQEALLIAVQMRNPTPAVACRAFQAVAKGIKNLPPHQQRTVMRLINEPNIAGS